MIVGFIWKQYIYCKQILHKDTQLYTVTNLLHKIISIKCDFKVLPYEKFFHVFPESPLNIIFFQVIPEIFNYDPYFKVFQVRYEPCKYIPCTYITYEKNYIWEWFPWKIPGLYRTEPDFTYNLQDFPGQNKNFSIFLDSPGQWSQWKKIATSYVDLLLNIHLFIYQTYSFILNVWAS